jgi:hypothetical protein
MYIFLSTLPFLPVDTHWFYHHPKYCNIKYFIYNSLDYFNLSSTTRTLLCFFAYHNFIYIIHFLFYFIFLTVLFSFLPLVSLSMLASSNKTRASLCRIYLPFFWLLCEKGIAVIRWWWCEWYHNRLMKGNDFASAFNENVEEENWRKEKSKALVNQLNAIDIAPKDQVSKDKDPKEWPSHFPDALNTI